MSLLVKMCPEAILVYVLSYGCDLKVILLNSLASMLRLCFRGCRLMCASISSKRLVGVTTWFYGLIVTGKVKIYVLKVIFSYSC